MNRYKVSSFFRTLLLFDSKGFFLYISKIGFSPYLLYLTTRTKTNMTFLKSVYQNRAYLHSISFSSLHLHCKIILEMFSISFFMKLEIPFLPAFLFPRGHERTNIDSYNYKSKQVDVKDFISIYRSFCFGE